MRVTMLDRFRDIGLNMIWSEGGPMDVEVIGKEGMLHAEKEAQCGGNAAEKCQSLVFKNTHERSQTFGKK